MGESSLKANTQGNQNVAIGNYSLTSNTTSSSNVGVGVGAAYNNTTGIDNVAVGFYASQFNKTGSYNVAIGKYALKGASNQNMSRNTAVGWSAGDALETGTDNVIIGYESEASATGADNQIVIGQGATGQGDNYAVIGNADVTRLYAAQDGAGVLYANGTIESSDRRIKHSITDLPYGLSYIMKLRPVSYYKKQPKNYPQELKDKFYPDGKVREVGAEDYDKLQVGFIAQEVKAVNTEMNAENNIVNVDEDGFHRMDYEKLVVPMIKAIQELTAKVEKLEQHIEKLESEEVYIGSEQ